MKSILIAGSGHWGGASFVGEHQIARILERRGWNVGFLSLPVTPFHLKRIGEREIQERMRLWSEGRSGSKKNGIWAYAPLAALMPKPVFPFRSDLIFRNWWRTTLPGIQSILERNGFSNPEILLVREPRYQFLLDLVSAKTTFFRFADLDAAHKLSFPAERNAEQSLLKRSDIVLGTSPDLVEYARSHGAPRVELLENGVDCSLYQGDPGPCPIDLANIPPPRAILVGSMAWWVDMALIQKAAAVHREISFVLVGEGEALSLLRPAENIHVLGRRPAASIPSYLRHSQIGLLPFKHATDSGFLDAVNPLKLHEYLAAGIPVVSTSWREIRRLQPPVFLAESEHEFISAIGESSSSPGAPEGRVEYAKRRDWNSLVDRLLLLAEGAPP